jgi:hypothetical protein
MRSARPRSHHVLGGWLGVFLAAAVPALPAAAAPPAGAPEINLPAVDPSELVAGRAVAVRASMGWYLGVIHAVKGRHHSVLYGDGERGLLLARDLVPVPRKSRYEVGDPVLACVRGTRMVTGVIADRRSDAYLVAWDDGQLTSEVPSGRLVKLAGKRRIPGSAPSAGEAVVIRWGHRAHLWGTVMNRQVEDRRVRYQIAFADGDVGLVVASDVAKLGARRELLTGEKIFAVRRGAELAPAQVVRAQDAAAAGSRTYIIRYEDGETASVPADRLVPVLP